MTLGELSAKNRELEREIILLVRKYKLETGYMPLVEVVEKESEISGAYQDVNVTAKL